MNVGFISCYFFLKNYSWSEIFVFLTKDLGLFYACKYLIYLSSEIYYDLLQLLSLGWSHIFYIESIARVRKLSLSSLLLYKSLLADQFYVQWPQFQKKVS